MNVTTHPQGPSFREGEITGVLITPLVRHVDSRGWLLELFREDNLERSLLPVMGYISMTDPGIVRGPHEHREQADHFAFVGPSSFKIYLWDAREGSSTFGVRQTIIAGADAPMSVVIPPGVVHAYKNVGAVPGMVINLPNALYAGRGRKGPVDEVRHENDLTTPYILD